MLTAEYTNGTKSRSATLSIAQLENGRRTYVGAFNVTGKAEARRKAAEMNAKPWNF